MKKELALIATTAIIIILAAYVFLLYLPQGAEAKFSVSVVDDIGRSIDLEVKPERVVSMAPSVTEIIFALGAGDKIVGVTDACDYPPEALEITKIREPFGDFSIEKMVELEPDLVIMDRFLDLYPPGKWLSRVEEAGLNVIVLYAQNLDGVFRNIMIVGKAVGAENEASTLVDQLQDRLDEISEITKDLNSEEMPHVFVTGWYDGETDPWTSGYGTFANDIISLAGGINIAEARGGFFQIGLEELVGSNPERIIILEDHLWPTPTYDAIMNDDRLRGVTAISEGRVYKVDANLFSRPGPRLVDGIEELARILHPETFS
jgi:iron complex transport system substrate-binding protein